MDGDKTAVCQWDHSTITMTTSTTTERETTWHQKSPDKDKGFNLRVFQMTAEDEPEDEDGELDGGEDGRFQKSHLRLYWRFW